MKNNVTICMLFRRYGYCAFALFASQVVLFADWRESDRIILSDIKGLNQDIYDLTQGNFYNLSLDMDEVTGAIGYTREQRPNLPRNYYINVQNGDMLSTLTALAHNTLYERFKFNSGQDFYVTLRGLLAGFDSSALGIYSNGIYSFTQNLSNSLTDTNSVFNRQLTAQEQMTNLLSVIVRNQTNLLYGISPLFATGSSTINYAPPYFMSGFDEGHNYTNYLQGATRAEMYRRYSLGWLLSYMMYGQLPYSDLVTFPLGSSEYTMRNKLQSMGMGDAAYNNYGNLYYKYYGNGPLWEMTNSLSKIQSSTEAHLPNDEEEDVSDSYVDDIDDIEDDVGNYVSVEDSRIHSSFLNDAKSELQSLQFGAQVLNGFGDTYQNYFVFNQEKTLEYDFNLSYTSSEGPAAEVVIEGEDLLEPADGFLQTHKPTINTILKIIIRVNQFIIFLVFANKAFRMVNEVFSA